MSEENQTPASTPETGPAPKQTPHGERRSARNQQKRRQRSVFQYITILFAAAFVLLLFTFVMERRQHEILQQENQEQSSNSRQHGSHHVRKRSPVLPIGIMVNHHDGRVDDNTEGDRDAGKGINMYGNAGECVYRNGNQQVHRQCQSHHKHIPPRMVHEEDEKQQDKKAKACPDINLLQFTGDIFRSIIADRCSNLLREAVLQPGHQILHRKDSGQKIGGRSQCHIESHGI